MFYALSWFVVFSLLALWSLLAWAAHGLAAWTLAGAGGLVAGGVSAQGMGLPGWLAAWLPPEAAQALESMAAALLPAIQATLAWAPSLEGGLTVLVWVVWGLGCAALVVLGLLASGLIALLRRGSTPPGAPPASPLAAR
jgi:hypothetical protein